MTITEAQRARYSPNLLLWCSVGLIVAFCFCVSFKLNGSSVGMWRNLLEEPGIARGLIFSSPKRVRFDEWSIWTPAMLSQARQVPAFPIENPNLGAGRAPLIMNVPVAYYTTLFRPQFWGFFLFDFERGFSFYWCCKVFGLLLATGWWLRMMGLRSRPLVVFGAIWIFFSSFTQWWFSSPAMLPEMVASWAICVGCAAQFFKPQDRSRKLLAFLVFAFFGINFILCLYPPYQIPLCWLGVAILFGVWREERNRSPGSFNLYGLIWIGIALAFIALLLIPFWFDVRNTLDVVAHTAYPGDRRSLGGDLSFSKLFSGVIGFFETEQIGPGVYDNICEASNFYPLWVAAAVAVIVARVRLRKSISPLLAAVGVLLIAMSVYCVAKLPPWFVSATLLSFTTEKRTLLAIGLANILFTCLFFDRYRLRIFSKPGALLTGLAFSCAIVAVMWTLWTTNPIFFSDKLLLAVPLAINGTLVTLFFWEVLRKWMPPILAALLVFSNAGINPIMRGLSPLVDSAGFREISKIQAADPEAKWIVYNSHYFAQLVKASGAPILNGTKVVPDLPFWYRLDPGGQHDWIYNRYANVGCELPRQGYEVSASLIHPDHYIWFLAPDLAVLQMAGYRYALFPSAWPGAASYGFSLFERIEPGNLWIYRYTNQSGLRTITSR